MSKILELTRGKVTIVDSADYEKLSHLPWVASLSGGNWYARRSIRKKDYFRYFSTLMNGL
jgi:hypothetical protein